jgi:hypothetical protein
MTNKQINQAIAEACGWKAVCGDGNSGFYKGFDNGAELRPDLPDYCNDLNAMYEAERMLTIPQEKEYFFTLKQIVGDLIWYRSTCRNYRATARQRAEAFLRTLGKWEEGE